MSDLNELISKQPETINFSKPTFEVDIGEFALNPGLVEDERPNQSERMMIRAELESMWSTCSRLAVGCVITDKQGSIKASAYNGAPYNLEHCNRKPTTDGRCTYCVHAETNAIIQSAKNGVNLSDCILYTLWRPCVSCSNNIIQAGIIRVVYRWEYDTDNMKEYVKNMFAKSGVKYDKLLYSDAEVALNKLLQQWRNNDYR